MFVRPAALITVFAIVLCACSANPSTTPAVGPSAAGATPTAMCPAAAASPVPAQKVGSPAARTSVTPAAASQAPKGPAAHEAARTMEQIRALTARAGERVSGTPGEQTATAYIAGQLRSYGYDVEVAPFQMEGLRLRPAKVVTAAGELEVITLGGSGTGTATGPAAFIGTGDRAGIAGQSLQGKVAIADRGTLRFEEKFDNAVTGCGAIALVVINNLEGSFSGTLAKDTDRPAVAAPDTLGPTLRSLGKSGATVTVAVPAGSSQTAYNVIARAKAGAECRVLVGGHHDSVPGTVAANDNASGTAHVIELARAFAADGLDAGLCFATFGGEEEGLFGSKALAQQLKNEGRLPRVMVNLDVTGIGDSVELIGDPGLQGKALALATTLGITARRSSLPANAGSDHQSFSAQKVPVIFFTSGDFPTIHSPKDVPADIDLAELGRIGALAYATISQLLREAG